MNELNLHYIQIEILKKLALNPSARFNELIIESLESEHMNYHLQKLKTYKLVKKDGDLYSLTDKGKDYTNLMDDDVKFVEKQPKTSVILNAVRLNPETNEIENLLSKRLRQPYFGKVGRLTGKVQFGETLQQAAQRELFEETGLKAKNFTIERIYHKLRHREDGEFVQDVIFYGFFITELEGQLISLPYQENFWISEKEAKLRNDLDFFDDFKFEERLKPKELEIKESVDVAKGF